MVDAEPLKNARYLETLGVLNIQLEYELKKAPILGSNSSTANNNEYK
jgi:hypothetical protein